MKAGKLRHQVYLMQPVDAITDKADDEITYNEDTKILLWASIEPLQGRELQFAMQVRGDVTHKIEMRYRQTIDHRSILRWVDGSGATRIFNLGPNVDKELRGISSTFYATEIK